jgi:hypothetical protein
MYALLNHGTLWKEKIAVEPSALAQQKGRTDNPRQDRERAKRHGIAVGIPAFSVLLLRHQGVCGLLRGPCEQQF